ncbi:type II toxin-antitoxin system RatA family toxin [Patulibacter defluvii]|uniref:type II toxin-antitoxin system RatA family toxin n=1 Tax=Patulibacter defluvii TaxID=3095358 RepID=UPI002A754853|nr:SRPBCC family protein [Patulibacter sp. DM4]
MALSGEASSEIDAPIEQVWPLIEDISTIVEWQGGVQSIEILERDGEGRPVLCEIVSDAKVKSIKTRVRFTHEPPHRLSWVQEKGDVKALTGFWGLDDLGGGRTRATYAVEVDPGRVLGMLVKGPVEGLVRSILVGARPDELKRLAEGA